MKHEELKEALRLIGKVLTDPRLGPGERDQLQKAKREIEKVARSGKLDKEKLFRAIHIVAAVLAELVHD
jgi:hypothetical protein